MANRIVIPDLNPVRMVPVGSPTRWNFRADWYANLIRSFQKPDNYAQKWITGTPVRFQLHANFGPLQFDVIDCQGAVISSGAPAAVVTDLYDTGMITYEISINPPAITGWWYVHLKVGIGVTLEQFISEPQQTVANDVNVMKIEYYNSMNTLDVVFDTGIKFTACVEAIIGPISLKSKRTLWEDQPLNLKTIQAIPYPQFRFILGNAYGVPDYLAEKVNGMFCMDNLVLDGVRHTQVEGAEWEPASAEYYARQAWRTDVRPEQNISALIGENNESPATNFSIVYNIRTRAFGILTGNVSNSVLQVTEINQ